MYTRSKLYNELSSGIELFKVSIAKRTLSRYNSVFFFSIQKLEKYENEYFFLYPLYNNG